MTPETARGVTQEVTRRVVSVFTQRLSANVSPRKRIYVVAAKHHSALKNHFLTAFKAGRSKVRPATLSGIVYLGDKHIQIAMDKAILAMQKSMEKGLPDLLLQIVQDGGDAGLTNLRAQLRVQTLRSAKGEDLITLAFDRSNPDAAKWAKQHAGELVKGVTQTTIDGIRDVISKIHEGELTHQEAADELLSELGDESRAELVASHETMTAANEGQREAWAQAIDEGLLTGNEQRAIILSDKPCEICEGVEADGPIGIEDSYDVDGEEMDGPPFHVRCECTEGIVSLSDLQSRYLGGAGSGNFGHEGRPGEVGGSGEGGTSPKADKQKHSPESVKKALELKAAGHTAKAIQWETGLHPSTVAYYQSKAAKAAQPIEQKLKEKAEKPPAQYYWKKNSESGKYEKTLTGAGKAKQAEQANQAPTGPTHSDSAMSASNIVSDTSSASLHDVALKNGYTWQEKTYGPNAGKYAYFKEGVQVSAPFSKEETEKAAQSMHFGQGPKTEPVSSPAPNWPVGLTRLARWGR